MSKQEMNEEFDRSRCFLFRKEYYDSMVEIENVHGVEAAYNYISALIEYALFKKEPNPEDKLTQKYLNPFKPQIDADQARRERMFNLNKKIYKKT